MSAAVADLTVEALTARVLRRAAELVEAGWCQKLYISTEYDGQQCFCALGAIRSATAEITGTDSLWLPSTLEISGGREVAAWNDAPGRTAREVSRTLARASGWKGPWPLRSKKKGSRHE